MFISDVVAGIVALMIMNQRLKVEVWKLVVCIEHYVLQNFVVEFVRSRHHLQVATMLWQAAVKDSIGLIISVDHRVLQPLILVIPDKALATF